MISVIVPCFRQARYLPECIASVRAQTYEDVEIVVSAGSVEDEAVARALNVRVVRSQLGLSVARNTAIEVAQGDEILPLDADDLILPTFLEKTHAALTGADIAATWLREFGTRSGHWHLSPWKGLREQNAICCCSLYRRSLWAELGGYDVAAIGYEDWDFWLRAYARGVRVAHVEEELFRYRFHPESMTATQGGQDELWKAMMRLRHPALYAQTERDRAIVRAMPAWVAAEVERRLAQFPENPRLRQVAELLRGI